MPSTSHNINDKASNDHQPVIQLIKPKKSKHSKKSMLHHPTMPLLANDWTLFPQDLVKNRCLSIKDTKTGEHEKTQSAKQTSSLPLMPPIYHVIEPKVAGSSKHDARKLPRHTVCLEHMSAYNCTVACAKAKAPAPADRKIPPRAPSPPKLPTPDLSDCEEEELWSCCGSWQSLGSSRDGDDVWDEMRTLPDSSQV